MHSHRPFTATERQALLQSYFDLAVQAADLATESWALYCQHPEAKTQLDYLMQQINDRDDRLFQLWKQYKAGVPIIPFSRCPYCQSINYHSIDYYDLDGLWWSACIPRALRDFGESALRPRERHQLCPHFWTLCGAVRLDQILTVAPIAVEPGPEVPFVIPSLLQQHSMQAVISSIPVGRHTAYPIVYYSPIKPVIIKNPFTEWSNNKAVWVQKDGNFQRVEAGYQFCYFDAVAMQMVDDIDFNLTPWIEGGQVSWIAPGDESLTLQQDVDSCPFLDLPGRREGAYIQNGECRVRSLLYSQE